MTEPLSPVAQTVVHAVRAMDPATAAVWTRMIVGALVQHELAVHGPAIMSAVTQLTADRARALAPLVARSAVEKARARHDPKSELALLPVLELAKALGDDPYNRNARGEFSSTESRAAKARSQYHDLSIGRYLHLHEPITPALKKPLPSKLAGQLGIPNPQNLSGPQRAQFQDAYHQIDKLVSPYRRAPAGSAFVHVNYAHGPEDLFELPRTGPLPLASARDSGIDPKRRVRAVKVSVIPPETPAGATFASMAGMGHSRAGAVGAGAFDNDAILNPETIRSLTDPEGVWQHIRPDEATSPEMRAMRRVGRGAEIINSTLGPVLPPSARMALQLGRHVGEYGPEAQKLIGPTADRAAYRYRGTPRKPDAAVLNAVESVRRNVHASSTGQRMRREASELERGGATPRGGVQLEARRKADQLRQQADAADQHESSARAGIVHRLLHHGQETDSGWVPSPVMNYLRNRLPDINLNNLQTKSGVVPPSEGILLDKDGKVAGQSVGFADDHYLPFTLKQLAKLHNGSYLRTRTLGGPTTEDLYTGLVSGAKSLTVISHNGVYTVDFDPSFTKGRRYSDKAARMVARYGHLLDAVRSQQVTTAGLHPTRLAELRDQAERVADPDTDPSGYQAELTRLRTAETRPGRAKLSAHQRLVASQEFFDKAAEGMRTPDGHEMSGQQMVNDFFQHRAESLHAAAKRAGADMNNVPSVGDLMQQDMAQYDDPDPQRAAAKLAEAMGLGRKLEHHLARAEDENRAAITPLSLNGRGYERALTALHEQFPYYIRKPVFHPWVDHAEVDTGYVRPRHNRPADALAGYFDSKVTGTGKFHADSGRFQNYRVRRGQLDLVGSRAHVATADTDQQASVSTPSGAPAPEMAQKLRIAADRALVQHLRTLGQGNFSPAITGSDAFRQLAGTPVAAALNLAGFPAALKDLLTTPEQVLEQRHRDNPEGFHQAVARALADVERNNILDVDPALARAHRADGANTAPRPMGSDLGSELANWQDERDFSPREYHPDHPSTPEQVAEVYRRDPKINTLVQGGLLPPEVSDGADLKAKLDALRPWLAKDDADLLRHQARAGYLPPPVNAREHKDRVEGLLRAAQLGRRHAEAVQRHAQVQGAPAAGLDPQVVVVAGPNDPGGLRQLLGL